MEQLFRPQLVGETAEENFRQLTDYLYQLTEQLEFILDNIGEDNLSQGLADKLNKLGANIDANATLTSEAQSRIGSLDIITVSDVLNSPMFNSALNSVKPKEDTGVIEFPANTMICYGTLQGTTATFAKPFTSIPKVVTNSGSNVTVSVSGITTDEETTLDYIAIGEEAHNG